MASSDVLDASSLRRLPRFAPALVERTALANGGFVLRSPRPLGAFPRAVGDMLVHWAKEAPNRVFLAERAAQNGWRKVTYAEAHAAVRALAADILGHGLSATQPLMILSGNSVDHALLALACMHVGVPVAPVSPAYSLASKDFAKLRQIARAAGARRVLRGGGRRFRARHRRARAPRSSYVRSL